MNQHHQENMQEDEIKSPGDNDRNYSEIDLFYLGGRGGGVCVCVCVCLIFF